MNTRASLSLILVVVGLDYLLFILFLGEGYVHFVLDSNWISPKKEIDLHIAWFVDIIFSNKIPLIVFGYITYRTASNIELRRLGLLTSFLYFTKLIMFILYYREEDNWWILIMYLVSAIWVIGCRDSVDRCSLAIRNKTKNFMRIVKSHSTYGNKNRTG